MQDKAGLLTRSIRGLGTPGYVSPEQQYGLKIDERTDQYSLAALTYEHLTGRRPLGQFLPPSRHNVQLPRGSTWLFSGDWPKSREIATLRSERF